MRSWSRRLILLLLALLCGAGSSEVEILAVATHETPALDNFRQSAEFNGFSVHVLGLGIPVFNRTGLKVELFLQALEHLPSRAIVMCTDSYDVLVLGHAKLAVAKFKAMGSSIVMAAEVGCWPESYCSNMASVQYDLQRLAGIRFPFLNSGGYIGYAGAVRRMLRTVNRHPVYEDQEAISRYYLRHQYDEKPLIRLDHQGEIFVCLTRLERNEFHFLPSLQQWMDVYTGKAPVIFHANGDDGPKLLQAMMEEHSPPFPVNTTAWEKGVNASQADRYSFWVLEEPEPFAPTHLHPVDQIHFWYRQGAVAMNARRNDKAIKGFVKSYELFIEYFHALTAEQRQNINESLTKIKDIFMKWMKESEEAEAQANTPPASESNAGV